MSLKFNEALQILLKDLPNKPLRPEHKLYIQDSAEISEKINQELINMNSIFKGTVSNWEATCTYLFKDIYKIWIPYLWIKMPFKVQPQRLHQSPCTADKLKTSVIHPAVENGYVNGLKLTKLFYWDMSKAIERLGKITCKSNRTYSIHTEFAELDRKIILKIVVKEKEAQDQEVPKMFYHFNLIFTFSNVNLNYIYCCDSFHEFDKSIYEAKSIKVSGMANNMNMLLLQFSLDSSLTVEKVHNIFTSFVFQSKDVRFEEILFEAMICFSPFVKDTGPLACVWAMLWQFKQADSVKVSELKEVFGIQ